MDIFAEINNLPILDTLNSLGVNTTKKWTNYHLLKDNWQIDTSFIVSPQKNIVSDFWKTWIQWWVFDFVGQYCLGLSNDDMRTSEWRAGTLKFFVEKGLVKQPEQQSKTFEKSHSNQYLLEHFNDFLLGGFSSNIAPLLLKRGVTSDWIQKHQIKIWELFANIGYYNNYYTTEHSTYKDDNWEWITQDWDKPKSVGIFIFPNYKLIDDKKTLVGLKLRRKDWKTIRGQKSMTVGKSGLLWDKPINNSKTILVEWEMDWLILRLLWYESVVANNGWVQSLRKELKELLAPVQDIICLYDKDIAWKQWTKALSKALNTTLITIDFPIKKSSKGVPLSDVNDYYRAWYDTKQKWDSLLKKTSTTTEGWENDLWDTGFVFIRKNLSYYDIEYKMYQDTNKVAQFMASSPKELATLVRAWQIKQFKDLCYYDGGKPGCYNTLDDSNIIRDWWDAEPKLHPQIKYLVDNICSQKITNSHWLHWAILYKLTHINDVNIPALILYWAGWSGKGTLINLLSKIFWDENIMRWLGQKDLESSFDTYAGQKLIVEYNEVSSWNRFEDKKVVDRLKGIIWQPRITVNQKHRKAEEVDNIAWFHLSSNHPIPLQLDSKHSWNRRFTIIKTWWEMNKDKARQLNEITLNDKNIIRQYIAWLYDTYPDVPWLTTYPVLANAEKQQLEENCEGTANLFFEWFELKFPKIWKITNKQKNTCLRKFCIENGEDYSDTKFKQSNFDLGLSHKYEKKAMSIKGCSARGYWINKTTHQQESIPDESPWYFEKWELEKFIW